MTAAVYVYGIVPAGATLAPEKTGVGDPPGSVRLLRCGPVAAVVSDIDADQPLGRPEDLEAHARVLDRNARTNPVVPIRFGAVLSDENAVAAEFLEPNVEMLNAALQEIDGFAEYILGGQYIEDVVLREILTENPEATALREQLRSEPEGADMDARVALGQLVANALALKRKQDTARAIGVLEPFGLVSVREPISEREAFTVAVLARVTAEPQIERLAGELADGWRERIEVRLLGPLAAYDFAVAGGG